ncbi:M73 family metallopeptidase [Solibacillus merdavium]|uniref:LPXTG cell wall anchor domain-containing protein n=1 Tax=Solibacillus merdavium TaxID=2762218 RepID=A0ABR8XPH4_9BACL|nr:hypothetical protein [Solibacillus merdavium]MBD8033821.1 hypothetical protein [Solibacillus merdavium]
MKKLFQILPLLLLLGCMSLFSVTSAFADDESTAENNEINISLSPEETLFDITNMKPGDWAPRTITVKNIGSKDFDYLMQIQNSGDEMLFNELLLEIKAADEELYQDKLADFKSLPIRKLATGNEENLDVTIRFPEHLGNEFQGLHASFDFIFTAEGNDSETETVQEVMVGKIDSSGSPMSGGPRLPDSTTNLVNFMLIGGALGVAGIVLIIIIYYRRLRFVQ